MSQASEGVDREALLEHHGVEEGDEETVAEEVAALRVENRKLRERLEALEESQQHGYNVPLRLEKDLEDVDGAAELLPHLYLGEYPLGNTIRSRASETDVEHLEEQVDDLLNRVNAIERGDIDPTDVLAATGGLDEADMIPIHRKHNMALDMPPGSHSLSQNEEIAARMFPYIAEYGHPNEGRLILPSTKVREVIAEEIAIPDLVKRLDVADPNPNTVRRVMKFVVAGSDGMATLNTDRKTNQLEVDADAWKGYLDEVNDRVTQTTEAV